MLLALFYARFHPERGPSIIHQYPASSAITSRSAESNSSTPETLFNFSDISSYIIPPYDLCNQPFSILTPTKPSHRILGFPVSLEDEKYARNRFTFNICFVLSATENAEPWNSIVRKTAAFFTALEEEDGLLQAEEDHTGLKWAGEKGYPVKSVGLVFSLLEQVVRQLNAHEETCVRVDEVRVLNLRLERPRGAIPPEVREWDVPLLIRGPPAREEWTWDLVCERVQPFIDGVRHVRRIAEEADVEMILVKKAVRELIHHQRVTLLDLFHFQAIYTLTADFAILATDAGSLEECKQYTAMDPQQNLLCCNRDGEEIAPPPTTTDTILNLYTALQPGVTLAEFCFRHQAQLARIDIRRFVTFGVLKGFLRRVNRYPVALQLQSSKSSLLDPTSGPLKGEEEEGVNASWKRAALSSGWPEPLATGREQDVSGAAQDEMSRRSAREEQLAAFLDGTHCLDEICVAMHASERRIVEEIQSGKFGSVVILSR